MRSRNQVSLCARRIINIFRWLIVLSLLVGFVFMKDIHTHHERSAIAVGSAILFSGLIGVAIMVYREYPARGMRGPKAVTYGRVVAVMGVIFLIAWVVFYRLRHG